MWKSLRFEQHFPRSTWPAAAKLAAVWVLTFLARYSLRQAWRFVLALLASGLILVLLSGCQNAELAQMQAEVNRAATELVVQDAKARQDWMTVHSQIASERQQIDQERSSLIRRERLDPVIAQSILQVGGILLCLLPLLVTVRLLQTNHDPSASEVLDALLEPEIKLLSEAAVEGSTHRAHPPRIGPTDLDSLIAGRLHGPPPAESPD